MWTVLPIETAVSIDVPSDCNFGETALNPEVAADGAVFFVVFNFTFMLAQMKAPQLFSLFFYIMKKT